MAQKSISRLEAFDFASQDSIAPATGARDDAAPDSLPLESQITPAGHVTSTADLALDLVLHEMLQQARLASSATGAAVALLGESGIRCRATAGATASEVAAYLQTNCKLVDSCLRAGAVQRCEDTESDTRFDAAACRRHGLRSVLICPVQDQEDRTVGVTELFSSRPGAFGDRDVLLLEAIGRRIVDNLGFVQQLTAAPVKARPVPPESTLDEIIESPEPPPVRRESTLQLHARVHKALQIDSKLFLLVAAIVLSVILGWMLGRTQGLRVKGRTRPRPAPAAQVIQPLPSPVPANADGPSQTIETSVPAAPLPDSVPGVVEISRAPQANGHSALKRPVAQALDATSLSAESSPDGVIVFEEEKKNSSQIRPLQPSGENSTDSGSAGDIPGVANHNGVARIPAEQAAANLLKRVEPDYPEKAREQKIQGPVVLDIVVGKDGKVQGISTIRGDPQLTLAAAHAVQQWRFKPWVRNGKLTPFESRITLNFSLP